MLNDAQRERITRLTAVMQVIVGALAAGVVVFGVVVFMLGDQPSEKPFVAYIAVVFGAGCIFLSTMLGQMVTTQARRSIVDGGGGTAAGGADPQEDIAKLAGVFQTRLIVRTAVLEGGDFFNLIAYLIEGHIFSLVAAAVLLFFMLLQFPTVGRVEAWVSQELGVLEQLRSLSK